MSVSTTKVRTKVTPQKVANSYQTSNSTKASPRWDLVKQYLPLVKSLTGRMRIYFPSYIDIEDIYSVGLSGLITATQKYDDKRYPSFGAYATIRVRGALLDELRRIDWMTREQRTKAKTYQKSVNELEQKLQRPVTDEDIQNELNISKIDHERIKEKARPIHIVPLDMPVGDDSSAGQSLHDVLSDLNQSNAREITEKLEMVDILKQRMKELPTIQQKILGMYYFKGMRLAEIAAVLELTESRICQIHSKIVKELKEYLSTHITR